jgi:hypothetical protein
MPTITQAAHPGASEIPHPYNAARAHSEWQAHLDAGRIGKPVAPGAQVLANRTAMIAVFDRIARSAAR